ncbi:MAG: hypothetical protein HY731_01775 [Candidatus Tectomicrobia bacterium]|nr:hypothetical protein [Candidatus Tectomicrobia bacterium]
MTDMEEFTEKFVLRLSKMSDSALRTSLFGLTLLDLSPEMAAEMLNILCSRAGQKSWEYEIALMSLIDIHRLSQIVGYGKMSEIFQVLRAKEYTSVIHLFTTCSSPAGRFRPLKGSVSYNPDPYLTLGEKKALAKTPSWIVIDRLLYDQNLSVIKGLLNNSRIREDQVLRIASHRPTSGEILALIAIHGKWGARYNVKKALLSNPFTPLRIALGLIKFLLIEDLKDVVANESLYDLLRQAAQDLLSEKLS